MTVTYKIYYDYPNGESDSIKLTTDKSYMLQLIDEEVVLKRGGIVTGFEKIREA